VESFEESAGESKLSCAYQLKSGERAWTILVRDEVRAPSAAATESDPSAASALDAAQNLSAGVELLLDVELEASLRFGCKEMPLAEILDLGPGDVVQLDRNVADPVDLIVGDKIVARGEVVLVNGNFGLRVTEVASPKKRLESIRCLF
jgi:flagellar motor switch protein FliN